MGFKYTDAAFKTSRVRGMDKYVLLLICERAHNETGVCWPSMRTIAEDGGISKDTVNRSVRVLVEKAIIKIVAEGHERKSNRYQVDLSSIKDIVMSSNKDANMSLNKDAASSNYDAAFGCDDRTRQVNPSTEPASFKPVTDNQPINPSTNQAQASPSPVFDKSKTLSGPGPEPSAVDLAFLGDGYEPTDMYAAMDRGSEWDKVSWFQRRLDDCYPQFRKQGKSPTQGEMEMFYQVLKECDENCVYPESLVEHANGHMPRRLAANLKTIKGLWGTLLGPKAGVTNGLLAQYKDHMPEECKRCLIKEKEAAERQ